MEDFIKYLITSAVGIKDVEINKSERDGAFLYEVKVPKDSIGLVIGKEGRTIKSIRNLIKVKATIEKTKVELNLLES